MKDKALTQVLARVLLVLRITLGVFLLRWGAEKFVVPQNTYGDGPSVERGDPWLRDQGAGIH